MIDPYEIEFRDGDRIVPPHVAAIFEDLSLETYRYTYKEAMEMANKMMGARHFNAARTRMVDNHLRDWGR